MKYELSEVTEPIIGAAIEVHRTLGPGLLESIYEACLCKEFEIRGIAFERQVALPLEYKGLSFEASVRPDVVVDGKVVVELKAVEKLLPVHEAQLLTYMRLGSYKVGLLVNFNEAVLKNGLRRRIL